MMTYIYIFFHCILRVIPLMNLHFYIAFMVGLLVGEFKTFYFILLVYIKVICSILLSRALSKHFCWPLFFIKDWVFMTAGHNPMSLSFSICTDFLHSWWLLKEKKYIKLSPIIQNSYYFFMLWFKGLSFKTQFKIEF